LLLAAYPPVRATSIEWSSSPAAEPRAVSQTQTDAVGDMLRAAAESYHPGKANDVLAAYARIAALYPDDYRPHALAATIYELERDLDAASDEYAAAIRVAPKRKELYVLKAEVDLRRGADEEAQTAARKATELDPNYAEAWARLGRSMKSGEKRRPEAIAALQTAIRLKPSIPEPYADLGEIFLATNDQKAAEKSFRQAINIDPIHMAGRFEFGRMLVEQGRLDEARRLWEGRVWDDDSTEPPFNVMLIRSENLKQATADLSRKPKDPDALIAMGFAVMEGDSWVMDDRQKQAMVYFRKALKVDPTRARAQYGIVKAYIQMAALLDDENKNVDRELGKLRRLDPKLADEMEAYRKTYQGGLIAPLPPQHNR
jgi:tetratricopeptide (TPR) repeat protein